VHLSNLCTEILEVTARDETAVCNLGSINLARHTIAAATATVTFDFDKLGRTVRLAVRQLDAVIDLNAYPIPVRPRLESAGGARSGWDSWDCKICSSRCACPSTRRPRATLSRRISEQVYLPRALGLGGAGGREGRTPGVPETRAARGELQFDAWA
jgi:ribonucleoside-diphosphate reductase alpha chain